MPVVKPVTVIGELVPVAVMFPGLDVTVYPVIAIPPFEAGAVKATDIDVALAIVGVPIVGASGSEAGYAIKMMPFIPAPFTDPPLPVSAPRAAPEPPIPRV